MRISFAVAGDHRGERPLDDRGDRDQVEAALAGDAEVVDVHHREVGAARGEQLGAVGGARGLLDLQVDALVREVAVRLRRVDAGVDGVRLEVEDQGRALSARPVQRRPLRSPARRAPRRAAASSAATRLIRGSTLSLRGR